MSQNINISLKNGTSKSGKNYTALVVTVGDYQGMLFPTKIESMYISQILNKQARKDFKESVDDDLVFEDLDGDTN